VERIWFSRHAGWMSCERVADACAELGAAAVAVRTDVTLPGEMQHLAETAAEHFGDRIDIWVNNAGVGVVGAFSEVPLKLHDQVVRTNLLGYMHGAHIALPYFLQQKAGVLINVNSLGGYVPAPFAAACSASKFGLRGFSEALRAELRPWPKIQVCDIFPGFIDTPRSSARSELHRL
jgi:NAD(P)-dependent dehydrogenase (short-subunit alcohol dehydrogenase family)